MKIRLGSKIKMLRKEKSISQEVLANHLGVSFQAVSKWENETAMPDVALIPVIAAFFGVSTDELFDYNLFEIERNIEKITDEYGKYFRSDPEKAEKILRDGLQQYPGNDTLLNCLINILPIPEKSEEVIELCRQLVRNTRLDDVRYDAYRIMAEAYCSLGDHAMARAAVEKIPEIYFSKLSVEAMLLNDKESYEAAVKQKWLSFEDLIRMMQKIASVLEAEGKHGEAMKEYERALKLIEVMECSESFFAYTERIKEELVRLKLLY